MSKLKNKGFLLVELMLTVAILTLGLVLVVRSFISSLRAVKTAQNLFTANLLLEEKIWQRQEEATNAPKAILETEEQGQFDSPFARFSYRIELEREEDSPILEKLALYKTTYIVSWQERRRELETSALTYTRNEQE